LHRIGKDGHHERKLDTPPRERGVRNSWTWAQRLSIGELTRRIK
jgi:hypothetical protein